MRSLLVFALVAAHAVSAHAASTEPNAPPPLLDEMPDEPEEKPAPRAPEKTVPDEAPDRALPPPDESSGFSSERAFGSPTWWGAGGCAGAYLTSAACGGVGIMAFIMGALFAIGGSSVEAATVLLVVGVAALVAGAVLFPLASCVAAAAAIVGALMSGKDVEPVLIGAAPGLVLALAGGVLVFGAAVPAVGGVFVAGAAGLLLLAGPAVVVGVAISTGFDVKLSELLSGDSTAPSPKGAPKSGPKRAPKSRDDEDERGPIQAHAMRY